MRITGFAATTYTIGLQHDGREIVLIVPFDQFKFEHLQAVALEQHGVLLPAMTQQQWGEALQCFLRNAIDRGEDIAPLSTVNRIVTGREEPRKH